MAPIFGQDKLIKALESYTVESAPKAILLLGEDSIARSSLAQLYIDNLNLPTVSIDENVDQETLNDFLHDPVSRVYKIDLNDFTEKQQNQFLKFIEEPTNTVHIVLEAEADVGILPTIMNRCMKFTMVPYTPQQLKNNFAWMTSCEDDRIFEICRTPDQISAVDPNTFDSMYNLCETLVAKSHIAPFENLLKVALKVNCKEEYDKYDFELFFLTLEHVALKKFMDGEERNSFKIYKLIRQYKEKNYTAKNLNKEQYLISFLTDLYEVTR